VIGAAATTALQHGAEVIGILSGFKWLMQGRDIAKTREHVRPLRLADLARLHQQGGSILHTARANPTKHPEDLEKCVEALEELEVDRLITIGGDDTAFSAARIAEVSGGRIQVVHVPKTIDNDLPLPGGIPTFGYETARQQATQVVETIHEDCRTTNRWFVLIVMGRHAGHLALGCGHAAGASVSLIREEYRSSRIRLDDVVRIIEGAIAKGLAAGEPAGVAVVAEGIAELVDPADFSMLETVGVDEHGHIRLADLPFGRLLADAVQESFRSRGISLAIGAKDVGYELRCVAPCAFDRHYTRDLGAGAVRVLLEGVTGALVTRQEARIVPIPFAELMDPATGRTRVRMVDIETDSFHSALALQTRVTSEDLADPTRLAAIAEAARLTPEEARERYAPLS
jgi:6-phosphofructokinase 1